MRISVARNVKQWRKSAVMKKRRRVTSQICKNVLPIIKDKRRSRHAKLTKSGVKRNKRLRMLKRLRSLRVRTKMARLRK